MDKIKTIKQNSRFLRLYKKGTSLVSPCLVCYFRPLSNSGVFLGLSVSKKIGGAVKRNRAKRVLRVAASEAVKRGLKNCEMLLVARGKTPFVKSTVVCEELIEMLKNAGVIKSGETEL